MPDTAAIAAALREMNAAENSYRRASAEFQALLDPGTVVLHKLPGEEPRHYWFHQKAADGTLSFGSLSREDEWTRNAVIVEAPAPRAEFLPRLPADEPLTVEAR